VFDPWLIDSSYMSRLQGINLSGGNSYTFINTHELIVDSTGEGVKIINNNAYPSAGSGVDKPYSIELWYRTPATIGNSVNLFIGRDDNDDSAIGPILRRNVSNQIDLRQQGPPGSWIGRRISNVTLSPNTLYHIIFTYSGSN